MFERGKKDPDEVISACEERLYRNCTSFACFLMGYAEQNSEALKENIRKWSSGDTRGRIFNDLKKDGSLYLPPFAYEMFRSIPEEIQAATIKFEDVQFPQSSDDQRELYKQLIQALIGRPKIAQYLENVRSYVTVSLFDRNGDIHRHIWDALNGNDLFKNVDIKKLKNEMWMSFFGACTLGVYDAAYSVSDKIDKNFEGMDVKPLRSVALAINKITESYSEDDLTDHISEAYAHIDNPSNIETFDTLLLTLAFEDSCVKLLYSVKSMEVKNQMYRKIKYTGATLLHGALDQMEQLGVDEKKDVISLLSEARDFVFSLNHDDDKKQMLKKKIGDLRDKYPVKQSQNSFIRAVISAANTFIDATSIDATSEKRFKDASILFPDEKVKWEGSHRKIINDFYNGKIKLTVALNRRQSIRLNGLDCRDLNDASMVKALSNIDRDYFFKEGESGGFKLKRRNADVEDVEDVYCLDHARMQSFIDDLKHGGLSQDAILQMKPSDFVIFESINFYAAQIISPKYIKKYSSCLGGVEYQDDKINDAIAGFGVQLKKNAISIFTKRGPLKKPAFFDRHPWVRYALTGLGVGMLIAGSAFAIALSHGVAIPVMLSAAGKIGAAFGITNTVTAAAVGVSTLGASMAALSVATGVAVGETGFFQRHAKIKQALVGSLLGLTIAAAVAVSIVTAGVLAPAAVASVSVAVGSVFGLSGGAALGVGLGTIVTGCAVVSGMIGRGVGALWNRVRRQRVPAANVLVPEDERQVEPPRTEGGFEPRLGTTASLVPSVGVSSPSTSAPAPALAHQSLTGSPFAGGQPDEPAASTADDDRSPGAGVRH